MRKDFSDFKPLLKDQFGQVQQNMNRQETIRKVVPGDWKRRYDLQELVEIVQYVRSFGKPNVYAARIPMDTKLNIPLMNSLATTTSDKETVQFLTYGWPLNHDGRPVSQTYTNHRSAVDFPQEVYNYICKEWKLGCLLIEFLGVLYNFLEMTISVTPQRMEEIRQELDKWTVGKIYSKNSPVTG